MISIFVYDTVKFSIREIFFYKLLGFIQIVCTNYELYNVFFFVNIFNVLSFFSVKEVAV